MRTKVATLAIHDDILRITILPGAVETLETAMENVKAAATLAGGKPMCLLVDVRELHYMDRLARGYYGSPLVAQYVIALAMLIDSPLSRALANFFLSFSKPPIPTRLFTNEGEATAWLKSYKQTSTAA